MNDYSHLDPLTLAKIEDLKSQRKLTLPCGSSTEYNRLTAQIQYLRRPDAIKRSLYAWRERNKPRIVYERACGIAYKTPRRTKPLTDSQRDAQREAMRRHEAKNPQRVLRQRTERILQMFFGDCAAGREIQKRPRPRVEALLGCKPDQFREHIRSQLARHGWLWSEWRIKWTMDHVIPVRKFTLPTEEQACYHYTNLRPLSKYLNHRSQRN
jgi:hypothetical protein